MRNKTTDKNTEAKNKTKMDIVCFVIGYDS